MEVKPESTVRSKQTPKTGTCRAPQTKTTANPHAPNPLKPTRRLPRAPFVTPTRGATTHGNPVPSHVSRECSSAPQPGTGSPGSGLAHRPPRLRSPWFSPKHDGSTRNAPVITRKSRAHPSAPPRYKMTSVASSDNPPNQTNTRQSRKPQKTPIYPRPPLPPLCCNSTRPGRPFHPP